jgi:FtsH-binding integral membrane protein
MALIGLVIAMVVNWFMQSAAMAYVISGIGVLIFTGLAAYDTQKLKHMALTMGTQSEMAQKMIIMGALTLYLDFVNLFLFMLQFMGGKD